MVNDVVVVVVVFVLFMVVLLWLMVQWLLWCFCIVDGGITVVNDVVVVVVVLVLFMQWLIQDFPQGGVSTPKIAIIFQIFAENYMKMKEFRPSGGGARPWCPL